jgi:hypothetical protein
MSDIDTVVFKCKGRVIMKSTFDNIFRVFAFFEALGRTPLSKENYDASTKTYTLQTTKLFGQELTPELAGLVFSADLDAIRSHVDSLPEDEKDPTVCLIGTIAGYMLAEHLIQWCNAYPSKVERFMQDVCKNETYPQKLCAFASNPDLAEQYLTETSREEMIRRLAVPIKRRSNVMKAKCLKDLFAGMSQSMPVPETPEIKKLRIQIAELDRVTVREGGYAGDGKLINRLRMKQIEAPEWMNDEDLYFLGEYDKLTRRLKSLLDTARTKAQTKTISSSTATVKMCCSLA